jgi:hypothetical protein
MLVRICDKTVDKKKREKITNIRAVECSRISLDACRTDSYDFENDESWTLQNVLLYIDPETKKATVQEMWLKDMAGE